MAWRTQAPPFNRGVAVAPGGAVAALGSSGLTLHDRAGGHERARRSVCETFDGALGAVSDAAFAVVCADGVRLYSTTDLADRGFVALADKPIAVSFAAGRCALAFASARVVVLDTQSWQELDQITLDGRVTALALFPSSRALAAGLGTGEVVIVGFEDGSKRRIAVAQGREVVSVAVSPGGRLFAAAGPVAAVWRAEDGMFERRFAGIGDITHAQWLGDREIVSAGMDGVLLLDAEDGRQQSLAGGTGEGSSMVTGVAIGNGSDTVCVAEQQGQIACLSRGRLPATAQLSMPDHPGGPSAERMPGRVAEYERGRLRIDALAGALLPEPPMHVAIQRYTERVVGGVKSAIWLELAEGKVTERGEDSVLVRIDGVVTPLPGERDPFAAGTAVRLVWIP